ncbi:MAG: Transcriptional regulator [Candidatus Amesbacteria bacterium GW2011_GWA2_47_11b]|uniref:Transcriptional regulator n=2 Tax=Candidatus Amesiibacteriota TaxID=1752730 RepID=A0A0G1SHI6_9BACT|nr:MAG: Transcriptional regulator [Microgenomates group bacterium GW2011_GWC1_46_20]KKU58270.1 MAG: Transcriptional regulator [Candidatus Amesbacteria bacterium GW2011_GWA2_47_11b]KKU68907.1 MAG: Transcriptional regulator [Candidatus Amesbacteria bacterium GW2011_GWA1_47_20]
MLKDLFISKTRVKLLETFLADPTQMYHVRDLVRKTGDEINAVRRELARMESLSMVKKEPRGNRLYYWFRQDYVFYHDLLSLVAKSTGLGAALVKSKSRLGNVVLAMLSGRFVRHLPRKSPSEVDLLVVGDINQSELASLVRAEEARREQTINYTPMAMEELRFRRTRHDPFLADILANSRVMVIGDDQDLVG